jgi:hypothetical protein
LACRICTAVLFVDRESGRAAVESIWSDAKALVASRGAAAALRRDAVSDESVTVRGIEQYLLDFDSVELQ